MNLVLPPCPASLRLIQHYIKAASEHETRDPVVTYWCRLYALQSALKIDKKSDEARLLLVKLMDWLEQEKKTQCENEAITNEIAAQAHIENYSLKLFMWADGQDRAGIFNKNVVKAFYTAGILMDVLNTFGELNEDILSNSKYAKWKAAYIHNCLKNGEAPVPGPVDIADDHGAVSGNMGIPGSSGSDVYEISMNETKIPNQLPSSIGCANVPSTTSESHQSIVENEGNLHLPIANVPSNAPSANGGNQSVVAPGSGVRLDPSQITKAQKYCKFASSALNYDDVTDAINYLHKALKLLEYGQES